MTTTGHDARSDSGAARSPVLPLHYWRADCFGGVFSADPDSVRELLPTDRLHPVRVGRGRAAVVVVAFNDHECSLGRYGEIAIAPCVTERPAPPLLPLLVARPFPGGTFVTQLPVTTVRACEDGRSIWGHPKFVADMDFDQFADLQAVRLEEGGRQILSLTVAKGGIAIPDRAPFVTYSSHHGQLIRTRIEARGAAQWSLGPRSATLELGDHPVAVELRSLGLSRRAIVARNALDLRTMLPAGEAIGADAAFEGYRGEASGDGRLTIRYTPGGDRHVMHRASAPEAV
jgi:Acetoacetate decarboxylase (ADC)